MSNDFMIALNWKAMLYALKLFEDSAMNVCDAIENTGAANEDNEPYKRFFDAAYVVHDAAIEQMNTELLPILKEIGAGDVAEALLYPED